MGLVLILDTALLTVVLAFSGGASNPFTVLYLVHITLSAVVLSAAWTGAVALLSIAGFGILFLLTPAAGMHAMHSMGQQSFGHHLQGMWAAFVLATVLTAFFVGRISRQLAAQREQIATLRESSARNARLAALTTLAAGAAHELNSPLGTIAVAAYEASRHTKSISGAESIEEDLELILLEVDRCQTILHRMAAHALDPADGGPGLTMPELSSLIGEHLGPGRAERVEMHADEEVGGQVLPSSQLVPSLVALIQNGLDASEGGAPVSVRVSRNEGNICLKVTDSGTGITGRDLDKVGEPFHTTKEPGAGLGLGVFLARAVIESRGGTLSIASKLGEGTCATVTLPEVVPEILA